MPVETLSSCWMGWRAGEEKAQGHAVTGENKESLSFGENLKAKTRKFTFQMVFENCGTMPLLQLEKQPADTAAELRQT